MFASRTIPRHLARGVVGIGALGGAAAITPAYPLVWVVALPVAMVAFRGCPMCWAVGLAETVLAKARGTPNAGTGTPRSEDAKLLGRG
jgi:hypothetical protein